MSCSPFDLKDYLFGELSPADSRLVQAHLESCGACRGEMDRLRATEAALKLLPSEEVPRRIALVSDKVFELRWWQRLWQPAPRWAFASAVVLAAAIVFHAAWRPAQPPAPDAAAIEARVSAEVARRIQPSLEAAVAASEARQQQKLEGVLAQVRRDMQGEHRADRLAFAETLKVLDSRNSQLYKVSANVGGQP